MHSRNTGMVCCDIPVVHDTARLALMQAMQDPAGKVQTPCRTNGPDTLIRQAIPHLPNKEQQFDQADTTICVRGKVKNKNSQYTDSIIIHHCQCPK